MDDFTFSAAVSALVIAFIMLSGTGGGIPPLFAVGLLALSMVGFFALASFKKAGISGQNPEYLFIGIAFGCYLMAALALNTFSYVLPYAFIPLAFCAPAVGLLVRGAFSSG